MEPNTDDMELPPGAQPLVDKYMKSITVRSMLEHAEGYRDELLSNRLQGGAIEEALCIYLLVKFRAEHPMSTVLSWFPPELVSAIKEVINERLAFLTALSKKSTMR